MGKKANRHPRGKKKKNPVEYRKEESFPEPGEGEENNALGKVGNPEDRVKMGAGKLRHANVQRDRNRLHKNETQKADGGSYKQAKKGNKKEI